MTDYKRILVTGAAYVDVIVGLQQLPKTGEDVTGQMRSVKVGGSAYNVQSAIEYLHGSSDLFAPIGKGNYADIVMKEFDRRHFRDLLHDDRADNGWDISFVEQDGERTFLTIQGIEQLWKDQWFDQIDLKRYGYIYVSGYELEDQIAADVLFRAFGQRRPGAKVLFDTSPRLKFLSPTTLQRLIQPGTIVHCNQDEIKVLADCDESYPIAAQKLYQQTHEPVLITLGSAGTYFVSEDDHGLVPGEKVSVKDTIGAGDSHCGAFLDGMARGLSVRQSIEQANHISALVVQQEGGALE